MVACKKSGSTTGVGQGSTDAHTSLHLYTAIITIRIISINTICIISIVIILVLSDIVQRATAVFITRKRINLDRRVL